MARYSSLANEVLSMNTIFLGYVYIHTFVLDHMWMHAGEHHGKVRYWTTLQLRVSFGQLPVVAATRNHALLNGVTALIDWPWYKCSCTIEGSNDKRLTNVGMSVSQPLVVAATRNHPLLDGIAALIPWLISCLLSASDSISTLWSHTYATVVAFLHALHFWALQTNRDSTPHCTIICVASHSAYYVNDTNV